MPMTDHDAASFSWTELATTDLEDAKLFYRSLFGWSYADRAVGPSKTYTLCSVPQGNAAGIFTLDADEVRRGITPHWGSYVSVKDVAETTGSVRRNGGHVIEGPLEVKGVGRMSVFRDPSGAVTRAWTSDKPRAVEHVPGAVTWNELLTSDPDAAGKFYASTFGWRAEPMDLGPMGTYALFKLGDEDVAGMMKKPPHLEHAPSHWLVYFAVESCEGSTEKARSLGAEVLGGVTGILGVGRFSVIRDPQGAVAALLEK